MAQYIDKSALVAEIERRINFNEKLNAHSRLDECNAILSFIDTIEVKEVDLDYIKDELDRVVKTYKPDGDFGWGTLYNIATHFFKLGLKASQKEEIDTTQQEIQDRMEVCPWREHPTGNHYVCTRFSDTNVPCNGACMWVIDNLKLKELKSKLKAQKGEEV